MSIRKRISRVTRDILESGGPPSWDSVTGKPAPVTNLTGTNTGDQDLSGKQDTLVSATNIKTINGTSILGSGNLVISGSGLEQYQVRRMTRR